MVDSANSKSQLAQELHALHQQMITMEGKAYMPSSAPMASEAQGVLIHRDFKPLFVDCKWAEMHGYTPREILGMATIKPLIAPEDRERIEQCFRRLLSDREAPSYESVSGGAEKRYIRLAGKPLDAG